MRDIKMLCLREVMRLNTFIFGLLLLTGCTQESYEAPSEGGYLYHLSGKDYKLVVRTRNGDAIEHNVRLQDRERMPKFIKSVQQIIRFHSHDCGFLEFIQPGSGLPSILSPLSEYVASNSEQCPIHFGAVENKYFFK